MIDLNALNALIKRPGFSQVGLATALGKTPPVVSRILKGKRQIKASEVPIIEKYLRTAVGLVETNATEEGYHLSLGRAVARWNALEGELSFLANRVLAAPNEWLTVFQLDVIFQAIPTVRGKVLVLNQLFEEALANHRNERETWRSLAQRLISAGERRQLHSEAVTGVAGPDITAATADIYFGSAGPRAGREKQLSAEQLDEDAALFDQLFDEVGKFGAVADRLSLKDRRGHPNPV